MPRKKTNIKGRPAKPIMERLEEKHFDLRVIEELAGLGCTDVQIGMILDISEMTLNRWKKDPDFMLALKRGKDKSDNEVVKALYKRAIGYEEEDLYITQFQGSIIKEKIKKIYAPDPTSCIFWLKNRQPDKWKDKHEMEHTGGIKVIRDTIKSKLEEKKNAEN
jgi:hypothetical protein